MKFWDRLRQEAVRRAGAILRMFRRQTTPIHPLPVLPPKHFLPAPLPVESTVHEGGLRIDVLSRDAEVAFPFQIYAEVFNQGVARDARWAHVVTADRQLAEGALQKLCQAPFYKKVPGTISRFLLHSTLDQPPTTGGQ